jgi:hypothetical protein
MPDHDPARRERRPLSRDDDLDDNDADELDDDVATRDDRESVGGEKGGFSTRVLGDLAKKALMTGIGAVFMSEDSLRSQLAEMKLPKEAMGAVINTADKTKKEIIDVVARETRAFLSRLEVEKMVSRMLVGTTIEINTRIRIVPKEDGQVGVSVLENDSRLVKAPPAEGDGGVAGHAVGEGASDKPRRPRRRRRDE